MVRSGKISAGPLASEFSPALMQQMAINIALAEENAGGCGIFSVNGLRERVRQHC